jgi:hypothetical protein
MRPVAQCSPNTQQTKEKKREEEGHLMSASVPGSHAAPDSARTAHVKLHHLDHAAGACLDVAATGVSRVPADDRSRSSGRRAGRGFVCEVDELGIL